MKKATLDTYIKKYNLGGTIESVKWVIDSKNKILSTNTLTEDKNVLVVLSLSDFTDVLEDVELGIFDTTKLKQMTNVLNEDVLLTINKRDAKITSISLTDVASEIVYVVANLQTIPPGSTPKAIPTPNVEIPITRDFVTRYTRSKGALPDVDTFTLLMNKKNKLEMVIGHSEINSNRIKLDVNAVIGKDSVANPISFKANYLKDILTSNSDCETGVMEVSDAGLCVVKFVNPPFSVTYYMRKVELI